MCSHHSVSTTAFYCPFLSRNEISCRIVYDNPKLGVCAISRPCGRPLTTEILKSDEAIMSEISDLRKELTFCNDKKLVLMISFASDEMIRETMKYPEVFLWTAQPALINRKENSSSQSFALPLASVIS